MEVTFSEGGRYKFACYRLTYEESKSPDRIAKIKANLASKGKDGYSIAITYDASPTPPTWDTFANSLLCLDGRLEMWKLMQESWPHHKAVEAQKGVSICYEYLPLSHYQTAGKAHEILHWDRNSRFCSACGTPMEQKESIMKRCPKCGREVYPSISTAILVLVRKKDSLLLVHARNFKGTFNSLVAGFLETGETLEECVAREVKEETGLDVKNITYFGNQPWPYPSGLMVGFIADYAGGEINLQDEELSSGDFYTRDNLPELPRKLSLARKMIDWWIEHPNE